MTKIAIPLTLRASHLLFSAAVASALTLSLPVAAQGSTAPVSSPTSPPGAVKKHGHEPARKPLAERLQAICSSADLNHDGSVSLDEFHQDIVQSWHSLSPDATGYVQLADLAQVPHMGKGRMKRLAAIDKDGDGKLSFKEVVETRMAYFDAADADQNDQLSIQECVAYERQRRSIKP
jgi:Ca2+-binding EF-hand superfamily protein